SVFYGAMHGEDIWMKKSIDPKDWADEFLYQFCTLQLPYFYLNRHKRLELITEDEGYIVKFSEGIISNGIKSEISKDGVILKSGDDVLLPLDKENTVFIAYSKGGRSGEWNIPDAAFEKAEISRITADGNVSAGEAVISNGRINLEIKPGQAYVIKKIW
ncbi:MAG: hypothetical protein IK097_07845, partial [Clostridia bacterium]|nr:hypothetical protein [Clostridia bacterium]